MRSSGVAAGADSGGIDGRTVSGVTGAGGVGATTGRGGDRGGGGRSRERRGHDGRRSGHDRRGHGDGRRSSDDRCRCGRSRRSEGRRRSRRRWGNRWRSDDRCRSGCRRHHGGSGGSAGKRSSGSDRLDEHLLDLQLVQRHLRLEPKPLGAADADRVPEVATGGGADEQQREAEDVRDEHPVRRHERHRAENRAEQGADDRVPDDASRGPPGEVLGIALDDGRIQLRRRLHSTLIGRERGWLEDRASRVGTHLQIGF